MANAKLLTSIGFRKRMKFISVVGVLFLSCYIGFILPLHHHEDGQCHTDCVTCIAQSQLSDVVTVFCLAIFSVFIFAAVVRKETFFSRVFNAVYPARAPPAAS